MDFSFKKQWQLLKWSCLNIIPFSLLWKYAKLLHKTWCHVLFMPCHRTLILSIYPCTLRWLVNVNVGETFPPLAGVVFFFFLIVVLKCFATIPLFSLETFISMSTKQFICHSFHSNQEGFDKSSKALEHFF